MQEREKGEVAKEDDRREMLGSWGKNTNKVKFPKLSFLAILSFIFGGRFTTNQFYWEPSHSSLPVLASLFLLSPCSGGEHVVSK